MDAVFEPRWAEGPAPAAAPASQPIAEDVAVAARLDLAAEAVFELRTIERRLLELLLGVRERIDLEHHEGMARDIGGGECRELALEARHRAALEHALEPHGARDRGIVVLAALGPAGLGGRARGPGRPHGR